MRKSRFSEEQIIAVATKCYNMHIYWRFLRFSTAT